MTRLSRRQILTQAMAAVAAMALGPSVIASARAHKNQIERKPAPQKNREHHVEIQQFKFSPEVIEVQLGDSIIWTNHDIAPHTATGRDQNGDESWDTGTIVKGKFRKIVVTEGISSAYFCRFHPMMQGKLRVIFPGSTS